MQSGPSFLTSGRGAFRFVLPLLFVSMWQAAWGDISAFVGDYTGSAEVSSATGEEQMRDMSVSISKTKGGFSVSWSSTTLRTGGDSKTKAYTIDFVPSQRDGVFAAAMQTNMFGHSVPLDPMKGEPYVWARLIGDTLSVYSLFVTDVGEYELQQYDRMLAEGGLNLDFQILQGGKVQRRVSTFLQKR
ncbi:MAG: hypothetical protein ACFB11_10360 [Paracoccaceae bacterium]